MTKRQLTWGFIIGIAVTGAVAGLAEATAQHWLWIVATIFVLITLAIGYIVVFYSP